MELRLTAVALRCRRRRGAVSRNASDSRPAAMGRANMIHSGACRPKRSAAAPARVGEMTPPTPSPTPMMSPSAVAV